MDEIFIPIKDEQEVKLMNPLVWAYVGDCVYELYIRTFLINTTKMKVHELHVKASTYVKASSQAKILKNIEILFESVYNVNCKKRGGDIYGNRFKET